jgi:hypothetical protein
VKVAVVLRLVRAVDRDADVLGLLRGQLGELGAELVEVQPGDLFVEVLGQHVDLLLVVVRFWNSSICAITWLVKLLLITKLGWPVAQPRFTRRPSASTIMLWPSGKVNWSTCGLMLIFSMPGVLASFGHVDLVVEVADVADDGLSFILAHVLEP